MMQMIPVLLIVTVLIFFGMRMIPGDPALLMLGNRASDEALAMIYHYLITKKPIESLEYQYINHSISAIVNFAIANREKECNFFIDLLLETVNDPQKLTIKQDRINEMLLHLETMPNKHLYSNYPKLVFMISRICGRN